MFFFFPNRSFFRLSLAGVAIAMTCGYCEIVPAAGTLTEFTSPAELDLTGVFSYAVNVGGVSGSTIAGVTFQPDQSSLTGYTNEMSDVYATGTRPEFGDDDDTNSLEDVLQPITYHNTNLPDPDAEIKLEVMPGETYKLQLLFWKSVGSRTFDVTIEEQLVLDEFDPVPLDENVALLYTYEFVAQDGILNILFEPGTSAMTTHHPILNALTLEKIDSTPIPGDVDNNTWVDAADAAILADHWGQSSVDWEDGDLNNDDWVNAIDASILAANWNPGPEAAASPVPEPLEALLLLEGLLLLGLWRGKKTTTS